MSTDGSDQSDIGRFDVYSTIDPRTEEFLRLSRKRQFKQGCACAAITATVATAVVIGVILIYEYSAVTNTTKRTRLTPDWLMLMNTSVNEIPFEVTLDKAKIGIDPETIKFLPLIFKTLKKNKYFDKSVEDSTSPTLRSNPDTVDNVNYKNIFSDTRNWMRMPTSRLYTIEYKTSPIVYFKNPTRNIDYYKKVRKIRDYQRIMNYVDKMISDKVTFSSTVPLAKNSFSIYKNPTIEYTTPMTKLESHITRKYKTHADKIKTATIERKPDCNCPKRMSEILHKLIASLQNLLPNFNEHSLHTKNKKPCEHINTNQSNLASNKNVTTSEQKFISNNNTTTNSGSHVKTEFITSSPVPYKNEQKLNLPTSPGLNIDYTYNNIIELLKPSIISRKRVNDNNSISVQTSITKSHTTTIDPNYKSDQNTILPVSKNNNVYISHDTATTFGDFIFQKYYNKSATLSTVTKEYEDYIDTTPNIINLTKQNIPQLGSIDNNMKINHANMIKSTDSKSNYLAETTELIKPSTFPTIGYNLNTSWEANDNPISTKVYTKNNITSTNQPITDSFIIDQTVKPEDITLEEELNKTSLDDSTNEENIKLLEDIIKKINSSDVNNTKNNQSELYEWELVKIEDITSNYDIGKSMIPQNRASYLEIQRNDWKPEEHQDYNDNINNYFFD